MMDQRLLDKRFHLDEEIRELLQFAFSEFGAEGVKYVLKETENIVKSIDSGELQAK